MVPFVFLKSSNNTSNHTCNFRILGSKGGATVFMGASRSITLWLVPCLYIPTVSQIVLIHIKSNSSLRDEFWSSVKQSADFRRSFPDNICRCCLGVVQTCIWKWNTKPCSWYNAHMLQYLPSKPGKNWRINYCNLNFIFLSLFLYLTYLKDT